MVVALRLVRHFMNATFQECDISRMLAQLARRASSKTKRQARQSRKAFVRERREALLREALLREALVRGESHSSETHNLAEFDCQVEGLERSRWRAWRGVTERVPRAEDLRPVNGNESGER